jgi:hypothetical protein
LYILVSYIALQPPTRKSIAFSKGKFKAMHWRQKVGVLV